MSEAYTESRILPVAELDQIADELELLRQNHSGWLQQMQEALICDQPFPEGLDSDQPAEKSLSPHWHQCASREIIAEIPLLQELIKLQQNLGDTAVTLTHYALENRTISKEIYRRFTGSEQAFIAHLNHVLDNVREWRQNNDPMTGLLSRTAFEQLLATEFNRNQREATNSTVAIIEIDNLCEINADHGTQAGEASIKHLSTLLNESLRPYDAVCRFGDEEFAILLPGTSVDVGYQVLERLRLKVEETPLTLDANNTLELTCSGGVAMLSNPGWNQNLEMADMCLYQAKNDGRNRIIAWSE